MFNEKFITLPSLIFVISFSLLLGVMLFFTETTYNLWTFFSLIFLYIGTILYKFRQKQFDVSRKEVIAMGAVGAWLVTELILNLFSVSPLLGMYRWVQLSLGALTFFIFFPRKILSSAIVHLTLLCTTLPSVALIAWNILCLFFPAIQNKVPSSTLFTAIYGHNHAYIYYLYVLIIGLYFRAHAQYRKIANVLGAISVVGVVLSFSRVGLLLLFITLSVAFFRSQKKKNYFAAILSILLYGIIFLSLSFYPKFTSLETCIFPVLRQQLCKNFASEARGAYWREAFQGIAERPLLGNGGGTFHIASLKYRQNVYGYSAWPHNEYLQLVYEFGALGVLAVFAYLVVLAKVTFKIKRSSVLAKTLYSIVVIFSVDALVNFNWNLTFLFVLHCMTVGLLLKEVEFFSEKKSQRSHSKWIYFLIFIAITIPIVCFAGKYMYAELFLKKKPISYVKVFPYSVYQVEAVVKEEQVDQETLDTLLALYEKNPVLYESLASRLNRDQEHIYTHVLELDPLNDVKRTEFLLFAIEKDHPELVIEQTQLLFTKNLKDNPARIAQLSPGYLEKLIDYANVLALTNPAKAREVTVNSYRFEPWRANDIRTIFLLQPEKFSESDVEEILKVAHPYKLWNYPESLPKWYFKQITTAAESDNWEKVDAYSLKLLEIDEWYRWQLWETVSKVVGYRIERTYEGSPDKKEERQTLLQRWSRYLTFLEKHSSLGDEKNTWQQQILGYGLP